MSLAGARLLSALAVMAWLAPQTGAAGQVNLSSRVTTISETRVARSLETLSGTIGRSLEVSLTWSRTHSLQRSIQISEVFSPASAAVSFELAQRDVLYTSPRDNLVVASGVTQSVLVGSTSGQTNVQVTAGAGNVSVASNGILSGQELFSITGTLAGTTVAGATEVAALALTPGFGLQNSNANALTLAAATAVAGAYGGAVRTALDIQQSSLSEYSPSDNQLHLSGSLTQTLGVTASGITNVGLQAGAGNVQGAHSVQLRRGSR